MNLNLAKAFEVLRHGGEEDFRRIYVELNKGFIPDGLRTVFKDNGITTIPRNIPARLASVEVLATGRNWLILDTKDKYQTYHIERDGAKLNIFRVRLYDGPVNVNRRLYMIPPRIAKANRDAHDAIGQSNPNAVWLNYRLVNVQARPLNRDSIPPNEEPHRMILSYVMR